MLETLFLELEDLLWGLGIISLAIVGLSILPKSTLNKLGQYPFILIALFIVVMWLVISAFN